MKKILRFAALLVIALAAINPLRSQTFAPTINPVAGRGSINFKELADKELRNPPHQVKQKDNEEKEEGQKGIPYNRPVPKGVKVFQVPDGFTTTISEGSSSPVASQPPIKSFDGITDNNTVIPPDVNGAVGPNHLFETLNSQYRILNKSGATISTLTLSGFWSGLSGTGSPYSDPHVVYDATTGRWLACMIANLNNGHYGIFLGASLTNDPTGSWYEYAFDTGPSSTLPDYPLLGYSSNWIVITTNDFLNLFYKQVRITVLDKAAAIAGTLGTSNTFFDASGIFTLAPAETLDAGQSTDYMLCDYNGNSGGAGYIKVCTITGTGTPVYTAGALIGVNQPWSETTLDATQKGSTKLINSGGTKMRSPIVRNGYLFATHTVYLPASSPTRSSTDFWQINPTTNAVIQYGRLDDATNKYRLYYPSLAVTANNDVLIGSNISGSALYASSIYAYRNGNDALNVFRTPKIYKVGLASYFKDYGSGRNRWGDYSATCMDPADGTFWTLQEYARTGNTWGTYWANVGAVASPFPVASDIVVAEKIDNSSLSVNPNPAKDNFKVSYQSTKTGDITLTVFDVNGNAVFQTKATVIVGSNQFNVNVKNLINGNYRVVIQHGDEIKQAQLLINK